MAQRASLDCELATGIFVGVPGPIGSGSGGVVAPPGRPVKTGISVPDGGGTLPIDAEAFHALDAEIRSVFPPEQLVTPDDVRRGLPTLEEAVLTQGWPTLRESRGKILFTLDNGGKQIGRLDVSTSGDKVSRINL